MADKRASTNQTNTVPAADETAEVHYDRVGPNGLAWDGHTAAPGSLRTDIPPESRPWLLKKGYITEEAPPTKPPAEQGATDGR